MFQEKRTGGIFIDGFIDGGTFMDNTIANNIVTGINGNGESGIILRGDCDDNIIEGNKVYASNYGISLWYDSRNNGNSNNSILKNNICNDNVNKV